MNAIKFFVSFAILVACILAVSAAENEQPREKRFPYGYSGLGYGIGGYPSYGGLGYSHAYSPLAYSHAGYAPLAYSHAAYSPLGYSGLGYGAYHYPSYGAHSLVHY